MDALNSGEKSRAAGRGQGIQIGGPVIGAIGKPKTNQIGTDESTAAAYEHVLKHRMRHRKKGIVELTPWLAGG